MIAFGLILAAAGLIFLIAGACQVLQNRSYAACSEAATGTVIRKRRRKVKNGTAYELTVAYTVDGTAYEKILAVTLPAYDAVNEGDETELRYKPSNPKKAIHTSVLNPKIVRAVLLVGVGLLVAGIALVLIGRML